MKQEAIEIINEFIMWFTEHRFNIEPELMNRITKFINGEVKDEN